MARRDDFTFDVGYEEINIVLVHSCGWRVDIDVMNGQQVVDVMDRHSCFAVEIDESKIKFIPEGHELSIMCQDHGTICETGIIQLSSAMSEVRRHWREVHG